MKKIAILMGALSFCVLNGACMTSAMLKDTERHEYIQQEDEISRFLMTVDSKQLIVVGHTYHYIFPLEDSFKRMLQAARKDYEASFSTFTLKNLTNNQQVVGTVFITLPEKIVNSLTDAQRKAYESIGFIKQKNTLVYERELTGKFYKAGNVKLPETLAFLKPYKVKINVDQYSAVKTGLKQLFLTPLTVTADGVIVVGAVAVVAIALPIAGLFSVIKGAPNLFHIDTR